MVQNMSSPSIYTVFGDSSIAPSFMQMGHPSTHLRIKMKQNHLHISCWMHIIKLKCFLDENVLDMTKSPNIVA